jgi:effector-binding domain-containing protein
VSAHVLELAPRPTAVVPVTTSWAEYPALWPALLEEVYEVVRPRPELAPPPEEPNGGLWRNVMLYKDDAPSVEVGVLVAAPFEAVGRVVPSRLPGGRVVTTVHRGDYSELDRAHAAVHDHAAAQGLTLAGPRWEIYGHPPDVEVEVYWLVG